MIVLKATEDQVKQLEGIYRNDSELKFIQDKNKNFVVNQSIIFDPDFIDILEQLSDLERIEFEPQEVTL